MKRLYFICVITPVIPTVSLNCFALQEQDAVTREDGVIENSDTGTVEMSDRSMNEAKPASEPLQIDLSRCAFEKDGDATRWTCPHVQLRDVLGTVTATEDQDGSFDPKSFNFTPDDGNRSYFTSWDDGQGGLSLDVSLKSLNGSGTSYDLNDIVLINHPVDHREVELRMTWEF